MDALQVADLAKRASVSADTVRYYSRIGLLAPVRNPENGYKQFATSDVARLNFIRQAQTLGFSLKEIRAILEESRKGASPCPMVRDALKRHIAHTDRQIVKLQALRGRMHQALKQWQHMPDGVPDGDSVCHLIESFDLSGAASE